MLINFNLVNQFVYIFTPLQNRKDKTNFKDITERFLFSLFDTSNMSQVVNRVLKFSVFNSL